MAFAGYALPTQEVDPLQGHPFYATLQFLGKGAFGVVVKVRDRRTSQDYAVKLIRGSDITKYVEYELVNHSLLRHPHIIQFKEVFLWDQYVCAVMEYGAGGTLLKYIQTNGRLKESIARWFFQQLMVGVEYCHERGVVNRDLKLENILLQQFADLPLPVVKICDFGLSKSDIKSKPKSQVGTLAYMAPEVLLSRDSSQYDGELADIWSCGVMLYVMLYGKYPFGSSPSASYDPKTVVRMIDKMINMAYPRPEDVRLSSACSDLLARMFNPLAQKRITLKEILNHPWYLHHLPEEAATMNKAFLASDLEVSYQVRTQQIRQLLCNLQGRAIYQLDMSLPKPMDEEEMEAVIREEVRQRHVSPNLLQYMNHLDEVNRRRPGHPRR